MKPVLALVGLTVSLSGVAQAQTPDDYGHHLVPKFSRDACGFPYCRDLAEYERISMEVFQDAFEPDVPARVWAFSDLPQQPREYAVGIKRVQGEYRIFALRATKPLGMYVWVQQWKRDLEQSTGAVATESERAWRQEAIKSFEVEYPVDHHNVELDRCEVAIDNSLGEQVVHLWNQMLLQARPNTLPAETVRGASAHGTIFHFSNPDRAGTAGYSVNGSNLALLLGVSQTMYRLCFSPNPSVAAELQGQADALSAQLRQ